jgi:hypothetical protein
MLPLVALSIVLAVATLIALAAVTGRLPLTAGDGPALGLYSVVLPQELRQDNGLAGGRKRYAEWLHDLVQHDRLSSLQASGMQLDARPDLIPSSFAAALHSADVILAGSVKSIEFALPSPYATEGHGGPTATFKVSDVVKGSIEDGATVLIRMWGGPFPDQDFAPGRGSFSYFEEVPIVLPYQRAVMLLALRNDGSYEQLLGGTYVTVGGKVRVPDGAPFKDELHGLPEWAFVDIIRSQLR